MRAATLPIMGLDIRFVDVTGPVSTNTQGVVKHARLFTYEDRLYIAETRDRGKTVTVVSSYPIPEGAPSRPGHTANWGPWSYKSCGCANNWNSHSLESLVAMDQTPVTTQ